MSRLRSLYIFDLDGTLSLLTPERKAHLANLDDPDRWDKFYDACATDRPNHAVIWLAHAIYEWYSDVWIWTGRSDRVRVQTEAWLADYFFPMFRPEHLLMREHGDHTADHELKQRWLDNMLVDDRRRIAGVFEDRDQVVAMWRRNGVPCFQVADGEF